MDLGLAGATAVVVGGTRGMGLATAQCLAAEGCRVAVVGRDAARLAEAAKTLSDASCPCPLELRDDVGSGAEVDAAFESVRAAWGELNILINAVGPSGAGRFEELSDADWTAALDRGALSAVRCTRAALPLLRAARWARIVNVTAMSVQHQLPYLVSYTAAKSALLSVTKNLARSLAPDGILVNAVAPSIIDTPANRAAMPNADHAAWPKPDSIAATILFLASHDNQVTTGAVVPVSGRT